MDRQRTQPTRTFLSDCARIHREWHIRAKTLDTEGLLALYATDAVLESPLVTAILDGRASGILRGHDVCACSSPKVPAAGPTNLSAGIEPAHGLPTGSVC